MGSPDHHEQLAMLIVGTEENLAEADLTDMRAPSCRSHRLNGVHGVEEFRPRLAAVLLKILFYFEGGHAA